MPRPQIVRNDTLDLQARASAPTQRGALSGAGQSQSTAMRNVADEQAQAQSNINGGIDVDLSDIVVNASGTIGISGGPGDLIRSGREAQAAEAEVDDQFDERVSSSPSIDDEDIDFEFVYALHTFVATVEGQANAAKGETMILLDDSNSYWWLVKIVKDQTIGYLPAEHIETPSERLARLNKHRNVDLSAAMLHDAPAKSQNPLRNALRRRGAKSVQFAPTQYFEYNPQSDIEGSDEEEVEGIDATDEAEAVEQPAEEEEDEITAVEPLDTSRATTNGSASTTVTPVNPVNTNATKSPTLEAPEGAERFRKNSNSSLKDIDTVLDTIETRKITLTPRVAQDDSSLTSSQITPTGKDKLRIMSDREKAQRIREELVSPPPTKGGKPKKGSSVLGGFFKKRSKKGKNHEEVDDSIGHNGDKSSLESRDSQDSNEARHQPIEVRKLEPRKEQPKPVARPEPRQEPQPESRQEMRSEPVRQNPTQLHAGGATIRKVEPESPTSIGRKLSIDTCENVKPIDYGETSQTVEILRQELRSDSPSSISGAGEGYTNGFKADSKSDIPKGRTTGEKVISPSQLSINSIDRAFAESPDPLTPVEELAPPLVPDNESEDHSSPIDNMRDAFENSVDTARSRATTWSDSSLKTFFEENNDVRDFLVLVHDCSGISVRPDHPDIMPLFQDANSKLQDLTNRLDGLLGDYLQRRERATACS